MRHALVGAAIVMAAGFALSGCGWFGGSKESRLTCPVTFTAPDADKMAVFNPGGTTLNDVRYGVQIADVQSKCDRADKGLTVDTKVSFHVVSNDRTLRTGSFQYFVSVVDGYKNILTKRTYTVPFEFDARMHDLNRHDELFENLPLRDVGTGSNYAIIVGLQLTEAQLEFNRAAARRPTVSVPPNVSVKLPPQQPPKNSAATP